MKTRMTKKEIESAMSSGRKFYCYFTHNEQAVYTNNNPSDFGDYVAILPKHNALNLEPIQL